MNKLELCQKLIEEAMKCLENNNKECVMRLIEELVRNQCHDGRLIGKEIADGVRDIVHELWLRSDNRCRCELLSMLRDLGISKGWVRSIFNTNTKMLNKWLVRCNINWEGRATRNDIVKRIEDLLRRMGWSEVRMCEEMWRFIGVDVDEFRKYGIEPCAWLEGLESLRDLRRPYWFGLVNSDISISCYYYDKEIKLLVGTSNTFGAIFFLRILSIIGAVQLAVERNKLPSKYENIIGLVYRIDFKRDRWPWPTELGDNELERILDGFSDEELAEFIAGMIDGDGSITWSKITRGNHKYYAVSVRIVSCGACMHHMKIIRSMVAKKFGIFGIIKLGKTARASELAFNGEDAIKLLRRIVKYVHHPLRRLRSELALALYDGRIDPEMFEKLCKVTNYKRGAPDVKRNHALEALVRAAPQTHTRGVESSPSLRPREPGVVCSGTHRLLYHFSHYLKSSSFASNINESLINRPNHGLTGAGSGWVGPGSTQDPFVKGSTGFVYHTPGLHPHPQPSPTQAGPGRSARGLAANR
jgi:hypothetical protein